VVGGLQKVQLYDLLLTCCSAHLFDRSTNISTISAPRDDIFYVSAAHSTTDAASAVAMLYFRTAATALVTKTTKSGTCYPWR